MKTMDCVGCRECESAPKMSTVETRAKLIGGISTIWRRKKCPVCGASYRSVEVPWDLAHEVLEDE